MRDHRQRNDDADDLEQMCSVRYAGGDETRAARRLAVTMAASVSRAAGAMADLLATCEAVGDDQEIMVCATDRREQHALADLHRDVVMLALEAE